MCLSRKWKWILISGVLALAAFLLLFLAVRSIALGPEGRYFDSDGVRIHYTDEGHGTPVLLIHGFAINANIQWRWPHLVHDLSRDYRVITMDLRGHGRSGKPRDPSSYGVQMVNDVVALMDHLHIKKAHVVGYSFGGFVSLKLASAHPERLFSAAVCGAGWEQPTEANLAFVEAVARAVENGEGFGPLGERLGVPPAARRSWRRLLMKLFLRGFNDRHALASVLRGSRDLFVPEEELRANPVPVLAMVGSRDGFRPSAEELAKRMTNCELAIIEGGGHMNTTGKLDFLERLQAFLAKHPAEQHDSAVILRPGSRWTLDGLRTTQVHGTAFCLSSMTEDGIGL